MTQEEKSLLLQDLCARLPYGVRVNIKTKKSSYTATVCEITRNYICIEGGGDKYFSHGTYKPYLRSISSMTEEEKEELKQISNDYLEEWENAKTPIERLKLDAKVSYKRAVFYNSHHLDWNDLTSKGLAIEVTEENNPYKNKVMITEDYVSFEVAKLLKEKGMNKSCFKHYVQKNNNDGTSEAVTVCTLQMAMKWLREVHNIDIEVHADIGMLGVKVYTPFISRYKSSTEYLKPRQYKNGLYFEDDRGVIPGIRHFEIYEEAIEASLKYSLENLI